MLDKPPIVDEPVGQSETEKKMEEGAKRKSKFQYKVEVSFAGHCDYYYTSRKPHWHYNGSATLCIIEDFYHPYNDKYGDTGIEEKWIEIFPGSAMIKVQENPLFKKEEPSMPLKEVEE